MARMAVMIFVVLAGGRGCEPLRSQIPSPLVASMMIAARAVRRGLEAFAPVAGMIAASKVHASHCVRDTVILLLMLLMRVENTWSLSSRDYPRSPVDAQAGSRDSRAHSRVR